ncbi:alpha/beta fold hydrolase [Nonomuraea sp. NPDC048826]|uniref:alpha/beta fold hydrolase n=1 Tax=Nonomuraea sp. NPDC048826 TaxID=3364347 RepID=UPI00371744D9
MKVTLPRVLGLGVAATGLALSAGAFFESVMERRDRQRFPAPGQFVDVGGGRLLHAVLDGTDKPGPLVVLESGMGCPLEVWTWVRRKVAEFAPVLCYERAGVGRSDPPDEPLSAALATRDLKTLLTALGMPGPYVLAGHSYGGLLIRHFAHQHPEDVAGLVFLDSSHPDQLDRSHRQRMGLHFVEQDLRTSITKATFGVMRLTADAALMRIAGLPEPERSVAMAQYHRRSVSAGTYAELRAWLENVEAAVRATTAPPGCPVAVLTATASSDDDPMHMELQRELAALGRGGVHEIEESGHVELIAEEIHAAKVAHVIEKVARLSELEDET